MFHQDDVTLDVDDTGVHFDNGRFNHLTCQLEDRLPAHYMTEPTGERGVGDFTKPTDTDTNFVWGKLRKIVSERQDLEYLLVQLGASNSPNTLEDLIPTTNTSLTTSHAHYQSRTSHNRYTHQPTGYHLVQPPDTPGQLTTS